MQVDVGALRQLRQNPQQALRAMDVPAMGAARRALDVSMFLVPVGPDGSDGHLRDTGFLSGPAYNLGPQLSTTWTAGYEHPAAGAIHQGFHWGEQTQPPPNFLRTAFRGTRGRLRKDVARAVREYLTTIAK